MKVQLLTDLHLEFRNHGFEFDYQGEDVTLLGGDIAVGAKNIINELDKFNRGQQIVYIFGNHEFYGHDFDQVRKEVKDAYKGTNFHVLDNDAFTWQDTTFLGTTLWTNFRNGDWFTRHAAMQGINDFRVIKNFDTTRCEYEANMAMAWLRKTYEQTPGKKIILTHFLPAVECIAPRFQGANLINGYFANDLGEWIANLKDVPYWFFGHTHDITHVQLGDTKLIAEPYGYCGENKVRQTVYEV